MTAPFDHSDDEDWGEVLKKADVDTKPGNDGWVDKDYDHGKPVEDFLYSVIQPPERDKDKHELFGLAKSFPQVTREGYKQQVYHKLKRKAEQKSKADGNSYRPAYRFDDSHLDDLERDGGDGGGGIGGHDESDTASRLFNTQDFGFFYRLRFRFHEELSEFWGMFVFMAMAMGATCQMFIGYPMYSNFTCLTFAWGFANMTGIYIAGGYSGAHLNPIITFNMWFFRGFPFRRMFVFWFVQLIAVICATGWVFLLYYPLLRQMEPKDEWSMTTARLFVVSLREGVPVATGWFNEVTATMVLLTVVFTVGDSHNIAPTRGMNAPVVGFILMAIGCCFGCICNAGMNPARDLGARFMLSMVGYPKSMWTENKWWWITGEITGPFVGGFLGALAYDTFCFDGPESPLNMPKAVQMEGLRILGRSIRHPFSNNAFNLRRDCLNAALESEKASESGKATI